MAIRKKPSVSFEFFPPKSAEMEQKLWATVTRLAPLSPAFVSVTYGAGGSTRERTHQVVRRMLQETTLVPAAHLTCVAASREEVDAVAKAYWDAGVRHIVALRGDPPGGGVYQPHAQGYRYAADLVRGLKNIADFEISVAAFPERHPEAADVEAGIGYLKHKMDAGAARAITQYFFNIDDYWRLVDKARARGVTIPIVPGVMPIGNFSQAKKFSAMCGATIPDWLVKIFEDAGDDKARNEQAAIRVALEQCRKLIASGVEHIHFYTLNRADLTEAICKQLDVTARVPA